MRLSPLLHPFFLTYIVQNTQGLISIFCFFCTALSFFKPHQRKHTSIFTKKSSISCSLKEIEDYKMCLLRHDAKIRWALIFVVDSFF